jgi:hypothetical protein
MSDAAKIVDKLLETTEKWDNAHRTYKDLFRLEKKRHELYKEMGRSIEYHRALAHKGLRREDVARPLVGAGIGATDNYKNGLPAAMCKNQWCKMLNKHQPDTLENCPECGQALAPSIRPISPSDLRGKFARYIVGVETKDGRKVFFDEPLSDTPWNQWEREEAEPETPPTEGERAAQRRYGKWW